MDLFARTLKGCRFGLIGLVGLLTLGVAGCAPAEEDGPVRIRIWHTKDSAERNFFEQTVAAYNAEHLDRKVEVLWREPEERNIYIIASLGGKGPEITYGAADNISLFAQTQSIQPIDTLFTPDFLADFGEGGLVYWKDHLYMVADQVGAYLTLVYNKDLMPTPPKTLDELITMSLALTKDEDGDGRPEQYALTWNYTEPFFFIPFLTAFGGWVLDDEGRPSLDTEATVKAIQFILNLRDKHGVIPREADYNVSEMLFKDQRAAAIINGPWAFAGYSDAGVNYDLASIPLNTETGIWPAPMVTARGYAVNSNVTSEKMPYVRDVIMYLTGAEMQRKQAEVLNIIPVNKDVLASPVVQDNPQLRAALQQVARGRAMPTSLVMRQIWDGMRGPYQLVMNGAVSAEEGARLMQQEVEKRIADTFL